MPVHGRPRRPDDGTTVARRLHQPDHIQRVEGVEEHGRKRPRRRQEGELRPCERIHNHRRAEDPRSPALRGEGWTNHRQEPLEDAQRDTPQQQVGKTGIHQSRLNIPYLPNLFGRELPRLRRFHSCVPDVECRPPVAERAFKVPLLPQPDGGEGRQRHPIVIERPVAVRAHQS